LFDIDDTVLAEMMVFAKKVAKALEQTIDCKRVGVAVLGLEVPHAHIHLVPLNSEADINFSNPKKTFTPEEFEEIAESISQKI